MIDQRVWWGRGDGVRLEEERSGHSSSVEELREAAPELAIYLEAELEGLSETERSAALEAAEHGYIEGRSGGYGQPSWLSAHAG